MSTNKQNQKNLFVVSVGEIQKEAKKLVGREFTGNELSTAIKGIKAGLSIGVDDIIKTAIKEAL